MKCTTRFDTKFKNPCLAKTLNARRSCSRSRLVAAYSWHDDSDHVSQERNFASAIGSVVLSAGLGFVSCFVPLLHPAVASASAATLQYENVIKGHATGPKSSSGEAQSFLTLSKDLFTEDAWEGMSE